MMQFYTFLETTVVTLALLPHFIAFFSDGEIPGSPSTLATTFLAFGISYNILKSFFFNDFITTLLFTYVMIISFCSLEFGFCFKRVGVSYYAHIFGLC